MEGRMTMDTELTQQFKDKFLICADCGEKFLFDAGEQAFFWSKGLSEPRRCKPCRQKRKATLVPDGRLRP